MWGFHTDTTEVNVRPFTTLWFAVTGKMVGGVVVNRQTITREQALIAHTRSNAFFVLRKRSPVDQPGKLADLVAMDRDYLTVPADQIKDIKPLTTMVGGKIITPESYRYFILALKSSSTFRMTCGHRYSCST